MQVYLWNPDAMKSQLLRETRQDAAQDFPEFRSCDPLSHPEPCILKGLISPPRGKSCFVGCGKKVEITKAHGPPQLRAWTDTAHLWYYNFRGGNQEKKPFI